MYMNLIIIIPNCDDDDDYDVIVSTNKFVISAIIYTQNERGRERKRLTNKICSFFVVLY